MSLIGQSIRENWPTNPVTPRHILDMLFDGREMARPFDQIPMVRLVLYLNQMAIKERHVAFRAAGVLR